VNGLGNLLSVDDLDLQSLLLCTRLHERLDVRHDLKERTRNILDREFSGLDFREIENVVENLEKVLTVLKNGVHTVEDLRLRASDSVE